MSKYFLEVGTTEGGHDFYNQDMGTSQTATATGLPRTGITVHTRLWSLIAGNWYHYDYTYISR